jgi:5'-3' exonuclease
MLTLNKPNSNRKSLVIVDLRTFEYLLVESLTKEKITDSKSIDSVVNISVLMLLSGAWIHELNSNTFDIIFVDDFKPYWRHWELAKIGVNYKGNRKKDPLRMELLNKIHTTTQLTLYKRGINILTMFDRHNKDIYGYEADDLGATIVQKYHLQYQNIYTLTVDTDWLPFTQHKNVTWLCWSDYSDRVRDYDRANLWFQTNKNCNSTVAKRAFSKQCISKLWEFKALFGDSSDNIRGNIKDQSPNRYNKYIDLFNPPPLYDLKINTDFISNFEDCLCTDKTPIHINKWREMTKNTLQFVLPFQKPSPLTTNSTENMFSLSA